MDPVTGLEGLRYKQHRCFAGRRQEESCRVMVNAKGDTAVNWVSTSALFRMNMFFISPYRAAALSMIFFGLKKLESLDSIRYFVEEYLGNELL